MFAHLDFSNRWRLELLLFVFLLQRVLVCLRVTGRYLFLLGVIYRILIGRSGLSLIVIVHLIFLGIIFCDPSIKFVFAILSWPGFRINLIWTTTVTLAGGHALTELHISLETVVLIDKHVFLKILGYSLWVTKEGQRLPLGYLLILFIRLFLCFWLSNFLLGFLLKGFALILFIVRIELDFYFMNYRLQMQFSKW